jgi:hypothetical protein
MKDLHSVSDAHCVDVDNTLTPDTLDDLQAQIGVALQPVMLFASPPASAQAVAAYAARTLQQWRLPLPVIAAALLTPYAEATLPDVNRRAIVEALTPVLDNSAFQAWTLAERLAAWRGVWLRQLPSQAAHHSTTSEPYSIQLRQLFRQAYLDLPGLPFILLLLADHGARFDTADDGAHGAEEQRLAEQTDAVFVPLAEMMGLWRQRRLWLDHAVRVLRPDIHAQIKAQLGDTETHTAQGFKRLLAASSGRTQSGNRLLLDKARTFLALQQDLYAEASHLGLRLRIWPL